MSIAAGPDIPESGLIFHIDPGSNITTNNITYNQVANSLDLFAFFSITSAKNNCNISRETRFTSPVGGVPLKMETTGNDSHIGTYSDPLYNLSNTYIGESWTVSVWAKADRITTGQIFQFGSAGGSGYLEAPALGFNITTEWQRFSYTYTIVNPGSTVFQCRLDGADVFDGATIWWDGLMVERSSSMSDFIARKSSVLTDLSTSRNNGTMMNGVSLLSTSSGTLGFDGVDDTVLTNLPISGYCTALTSWTMSCWMRFDNLPIAPLTNNYGVVMGAVYYCGPAIYWFCDGTNNYVYGFIRDKSAYRNTASYTTTLRKFNLFSLVNNRTNNLLEFYVNGALFATVGGPTTEYDSTLTPTAGNIGINRAQVDGGGLANYRYFNGRVGQATIHNRALSAQEIQQNFNALRSRYGI